MSAHFDTDKCYGYWRCDNCGRALSAAATGVMPQLPPPWRVIHVEGFIGDFHVCKDKCERELRVQKSRELSHK